MMKRIIVVLNLFAFCVFAQDHRVRRYVKTMIDNSEVEMHGIISDTSDIVRTEYGSGDNAVRDEIRDTSTTVWNDSIPTIRGEIRDTSTIVWNDSIAKFRDRAVIDTLDADSTNADHAVVNTTFKTLNIIDLTTSTVIDSFKLSGASDTLFFFVGGSKFAATKP